MGWWVALLTWVWVVIYLIPQLPTEKYEPPLEEKFVITTYENGYCMNTETLASRIIRSVESVKID